MKSTLSQENSSLIALPKEYLFSEISRRVKEREVRSSSVEWIDLSVGDPSLPIFPSIVKEWKAMAAGLGDSEKYTGYGPIEGYGELREKIAEVWYGGKVEADEIFISDGAKPDIGRLQFLFSSTSHVAIQSPAYPVYAGASLLSGKSKITFIPCMRSSGFSFFDNSTHSLSSSPFDLYYLCSPHNPTGLAAGREELQQLVSWAKASGCILLFDSAYSAFVGGEKRPHSIYSIPEACQVAIEIGSFSKCASFTGVRLGWSVVPRELCFRNGVSVREEWKRVLSHLFNGASNLAQTGGMAFLQPESQMMMQEHVAYYRENSLLLKKALQELSCIDKILGGVDAPFLWVKMKEMNAWQGFEFFLDRAIISTPGIGFGKEGESFVRLSTFCLRDQIQKAIDYLFQ